MPRTLTSARKKAAPDTLTGSLFCEDVFSQPVEETPLSVREVIAQMVWSHSRRNLLEQCPRQYYFKHYASLRNGQDAALREQLQTLKKLTNRHFAAGQHLHSVIAYALRQSQNGRSFSCEMLCSMAKERFRKDVAYSSRDPQGNFPPQGKYPPALLHEYFYGHPEAQALCLEMEERLDQAVTNFATHPNFEEIRRGATQPEARIEIKCDFEFGTKVTGRIDLLYPSETGFIVVDWKMGDNHDEGDDSLQLATYALWVCREFECEPEQVQVYKAFLGNAALVPFCIGADALEAAQSRILLDAARMATVDDYAKQGVSEVFPPCAQAGICRACAYLAACPEGKECLDDDAIESNP